MHTLGPWTSVRNINGCQYGVTAPTPTGFRIIALLDDGNQGYDNRANAQLVASAPDMLAALKMIQAQLRIEGRPSIVVDTAIKKALGEL